MHSNYHPQIIAVKLTRDAERHLKSGHPWIYSKSIVKQSKEGHTGDICIIYSQNKNSMIGIGLYDPSSPIRIKILDLGKNIRLDAEYWLQKVQVAFDLRAPLFASDTNAFRMIFGENDGFPGLILDVYNRIGVIKIYSGIWFPHFGLILSAIVQVIDVDAVVLRLSRSLDKSDLLPIGWSNGATLYGHLDDEELIFREHGLKFRTNVIKGHKTGFFLDHRHNRVKVGKISAGKRVLDVFSYAGGFSVHALAGGASEVVSLDISAQAQALAKDNIKINNLGNHHKVIIGDAFKEMQKMIETGQKFDLVIIDPPSFASKESQVKGALSSYRSLVQLGAKLVSKNGILVMASCSSRVSSKVFFELVEKTLAKTEGRSGKEWTCKELTSHDIDHPISFPEGEYLKCGYYHSS
jgi:23S rRNA (cytosine1962-C5)-methyltransferase